MSVRTGIDDILAAQQLTRGGRSQHLAGGHLGVRSREYWKGTACMSLTRGEAVGYDAELMAFKFTMRNGERIVQCQISHAALSDLACHGSRAAARDLPAEFEAHRELIEAIASAQFDQTSNRDTYLVNIYAKHVSNSAKQR